MRNMPTLSRRSTPVLLTLVVTLLLLLGAALVSWMILAENSTADAPSAAAASAGNDEAREAREAREPSPDPAATPAPPQQPPQPREWEAPDEGTEASAPDPAQSPAGPDREAGEAAVLVGRILDDEGNPVANARLSLHRNPFADRAADVLVRPAVAFGAGEANQAYSREDGTFRLVITRRVRDEAHWIVAHPPSPFAVASADVPHEFVATFAFAGQAVDRVAAEPFDVGDIVVPIGGAIEGRVTNEAGEPVAGATVRYGAASAQVTLDDGARITLNTLDVDGPRATTDEDGRFRLEGVALGAQSITVLAERYARQVVHDIEVESGRTTRDVEVTLEASARLLFTVHDPEREPVANASVSVHLGRGLTRWRLETIQSRLPLQRSKTTDSQGRVTFETVHRSRGLIVVEAPGRQRVVQRFLVVNGRDHEITVVLRGAVVLTVRPLDADTGEPILADADAETIGRQAQLYLYEDREERQMSHTSELHLDDDGMLRWTNVPLEAVAGQIWVRGYHPLNRSYLALSEHEPLDLGNVNFNRGTRYRVYVETEEGEPVANARVWASGHEPPYMARYSEAGITDDHGVWESSPVGGAYAVFSAHYREARGRTETRNRLAAEPIDVRVPIIDRSEEDLAAVYGTAYDERGEIAANTLVYIAQVPFSGGEFTWSDSMRTDSQGQFRFDDLEPGEYYVLSHNLKIPHRVPWNHRFQLSRGREIERDVQFGWQAIRGTLTWHDESPAAGLPLSIESRDNGETFGNGRTDEHGRFSIVPADEARHWLIRVDVEPGRTIDLPASGTRSRDVGELRLPDLNPDARASVRAVTVCGRTNEPIRAQIWVSVFGQADRFTTTAIVDGEKDFHDLPVGTATIAPSAYVDGNRYVQRRKGAQLEPGGFHVFTLRIYEATTAHVVVHLADTGLRYDREILRITTEADGIRIPRRSGRLPSSHIELIGLMPGAEHIATIELENYMTKQIRFTPTANEPITIDVTLEPQ